MDVLLHVENGRPKRPNTDNRGTYVQDGLRPSLSGSPLEDFFTSRMGRISYGHRDIQGIDDGLGCATRELLLRCTGRLTYSHLRKITRSIMLCSHRNLLYSSSSTSSNSFIPFKWKGITFRDRHFSCLFIHQAEPRRSSMESSSSIAATSSARDYEEICNKVSSLSSPPPFSFYPQARFATVFCLVLTLTLAPN